MITVGYDFGTHQTKICIEQKEGVELEYSFYKWKDLKGNMQYTIPSIIHISDDGLLSYGYIQQSKRDSIIRYFKQNTFFAKENGLDPFNNDYLRYSIWYTAYILFNMEKVYGNEFSIQMGVPTDGRRLQLRKEIAVTIIVSAYRLVEDIFEGNLDKFLRTPIDMLRKLTKIIQYSKSIKDEYSILVFPEAYACLKPLISFSKISNGMSLMIDIGGGTTDISFFTIENNKPQVYDYYSIDKGLNFLANYALYDVNDNRIDSTIKTQNQISMKNRTELINDIAHVVCSLISRLESEFTKQSDLSIHRLRDALKTRPVIYTGGGSTFEIMRSQYSGFIDVIPVTDREWKKEYIKDIDEIKTLGLCPILSTAYGLSISVASDDIKCLPFSDIFRSLRKEDYAKQLHISHNYDFDYGTDYDALK